MSKKNLPTTYANLPSTSKEEGMGAMYWLITFLMIWNPVGWYMIFKGFKGLK